MVKFAEIYRKMSIACKWRTYHANKISEPHRKMYISYRKSIALIFYPEIIYMDKNPTSISSYVNTTSDKHILKAGNNEGLQCTPRCRNCVEYPLTS
jgi:hypothetical protein